MSAQNFLLACCFIKMTILLHLSEHYLGFHQLFPLECEECGKRYRGKHSLRNHLRGHLGQRNERCNVCGQTFVTRERLLVHQQLHLGKGIGDTDYYLV